MRFLVISFLMTELRYRDPRPTASAAAMRANDTTFGGIFENINDPGMAPDAKAVDTSLKAQIAVC